MYFAVLITTANALCQNSYTNMVDLSQTFLTKKQPIGNIIMNCGLAYKYINLTETCVRHLL